MAPYRVRAPRPSGASLFQMVLALVIVCGAGTRSLDAQCLQDQIEAPGLGPGDFFGFAVARDGQHLAIGSPRFDALGAGAGAVFTYQRIGSEWVNSGLLFPDSLAPGDEAGSSVALDGDTLVVGLRGDDFLGPDSGTARVFDFVVGGFWVEVATLNDPDGAPGDKFGKSVDIQGDLAVVGSPDDLVNGVPTGSVSVFRRIGGFWQHITKLSALGGQSGDAFGTSVSLSGSRLAVGVPRRDGMQVDIGAAIVFEETPGGWIQTDQISDSTGAADDLFGTELLLDGERLLVGAPFNSDQAFEAGAVFPYRLDNGSWVQGTTIYSPTPGESHYFGAAIDTDGGDILIGEPFAPVGTQTNAGIAHLYVEVAAIYGFVTTLFNPNPSGRELLGTAVTLEAGEAVIGAYLAPLAGFASGAVFRFVVDGEDCDGNGLSDLCDIALGNGFDCDGNGVLDSCDVMSGAATDCDVNGILDSCDIASGAADCDLNGLLDICEIAMSDCNNNGALDACESDCNRSGLPDDCDISSGMSLDCNTNNNPDECDIFFGVSSDCDSNGIPDECDLETGVAGDCNENGVSDACDILSGVSEDIDGDGFPDECGVRYIRGDINNDGVVNIADANYMLSYLTGNGPAPECFYSADANGDFKADIADGIFVLYFVTGSGPPPPPPFPNCGIGEERPEEWSCLSPPPCP